jgi:hypothetical protein
MAETKRSTRAKVRDESYDSSVRKSAVSTARRPNPPRLKSAVQYSDDNLSNLSSYEPRRTAASNRDKVIRAPTPPPSLTSLFFHTYFSINQFLIQSCEPK